MENEWRTSLRQTIDILRKDIEIDRGMPYLNYERYIWQLRGISLLLAGMLKYDDIKTEIDALVKELRAMKSTP